MSGTEVETEVACNTSKTATKARGYMLTINNFTEEIETKLVKDTYKFLVYQVEKGESGTEHIQAFIYYKNPRVWPKKRYNTAHIEISKSIQASIKYCKKEETRIRGPYEFGEMPEQGRRKDLEEVARSVMSGEKMENIAKENPEHYVRYHKGLQALRTITIKHRTRKPETIWLWGKAGVGKTKYVIDKHGADNVYIKDGTMWWDGYNNEEAILVDDFDGKWPFRDFLRFLDRYAYQGQYKGGYTKINSPYIYITCEFEPDEIFTSLNAEKDNTNTIEQVERRLDRIIEITGKDMVRKIPIRERI